MDIVEQHAHAFTPEIWPFKNEPTNRVTYASAAVIRKERNLTVVYHDHDGDWQFLHSDMTDDDECHIVCMGCIFERQPVIAELATLPVGWRAHRSEQGDTWQREPYEASDDLA